MLLHLAVSRADFFWKPSFSLWMIHNHIRVRHRMFANFSSFSYAPYKHIQWNRAGGPAENFQPARSIKPRRQVVSCDTAMEALVAVGLASNIVGFLDVAAKFYAAINEICEKGQTFHDQEYTVITQDLSKVCSDLTHSVTVAPVTGTSTSSNQVSGTVDISDQKAANQKTDGQSASSPLRPDAPFSQMGCW